MNRRFARANAPFTRANAQTNSTKRAFTHTKRGKNLANRASSARKSRQRSGTSRMSKERKARKFAKKFGDRRKYRTFALANGIGLLAERLGTGLQNRLLRFDSGRDLDKNSRAQSLPRERLFLSAKSMYNNRRKFCVFRKVQN